MIHVTLSSLIVIYLLLVIGGLFILWLIGEVIRLRRLRRIRRYHLICQVCGHHYRDKTDDPMPVCPDCGRPNERGLAREF